MNHKSKRKLIILGIAIVITIATVGTVLGLNGYFGGTSASSVPSDTMTRGLVGYWSFDEGSGTTAYDAGNYSNDGTLGTTTDMTTRPKWTTGKVSGALQFDGVDDYVDAGNNASLDITDAITVEGWFNRIGVGLDITTALIDKGNSVDGYSWRLWLNEDHQPYFRIVDDSSNHDVTGSSGDELNIGTWYHVVGTYDGSNVQLYINGILINTGTHSGDIDSVAGADVSIGRKSETNGNYFNGLIDEVRIYNRALSAEEVRYHYNRGGPVAHWKFDEGSGETAYDSTDNNNDGTLNLGSLGNTATSAAWVSGKYGTALRFDGVDDYVEATSSSGGSLNPSQGVSMFGWIKPNSLNSGSWTYLGGISAAYLVAYSDNYDGYDKFDSHVYIDGGWRFVDTNQEWQTGVWQHLGLTYDSNARTIKAYYNGKEVGSNTLSGLNSYTINQTGNSFFLNTWSSTPSSPLDGTIDDVRIYDYARTPDEIRLDYNAGLAAHFGKSTENGSLSACDTDPGGCMTLGLVGYWNFDEGTGQTAYDASDYSNDGILGSSAGSDDSDPRWTTGKVDGALSFDGTGNDDKVKVPYFDIIGWEEVSVEAWVKSAGNNENWAKIFTTGYGGMSPPTGFSLRTNSNRYPQFYISGSDGYFFVSGAQLPIGEWTHLIGVFDSLKAKVYLYVNGEATSADASGTIQRTSTSNIFTIGARNDFWYGFNGTIDEVRIYNRALSAEEVRYHYNRGGPVGYWKFDEGAGQQAFDSSGQGNDGTLNLGTLGNTATSAAWVSGKYGTALRFDGVDDYVVSNSNITGSTKFSHSLWFKSNRDPTSAEYLFTQGTDDPSAYIDSSDKKIKVKADGAAEVGSLSTVNDGKWHHLQITADGTTIKLYLDGVLEDSDPYTGSSATAQFYLAAEDSSPNNPFHGLIDDVRIYDYARTPDEIRLDYNAGLAAHFGKSTENCSLSPADCMTLGLVGYWNFDEGTGQTVYDGSDYANNGTLGASASAGADDPKWTSDSPSTGSGQNSGTSLNFDGVNDYVLANHDLSVNQGTIELWAKPAFSISAVTNCGENPQYGLWEISYKDWEPNVFWAQASRPWASWLFYLRTDEDVGHQVRTRKNNCEIIANKWYHIVYTWKNFNSGEANAEMHLYVNGVIETSGGSVTNVQINFSNFLSNQITLGLQWSYFPGVIDEVRNYNRALSAEEIRYHYNRGGPIAYWKFDEGEGGTAYDSSINTNNGTLNLGTLGNTATSAAWVAGKYGSALRFDGVDDYVDMGDVYNSVKTVSFWLKADSLDEDILDLGTASTTVSGGIVTAPGFTSPTIYVNGRESSTITANTWHHIAITTDTGVNANAVNLGKAGTNYDGILDDVRFYQYARTPEQVMQDYNSGLSTHFR